MRKTSRNLKRIKFFKRLLWFALCQIIVLISFFGINRGHNPIKEEEIQYTTIIVEKVESGHFIGGGRKLSLFFNSVRYDFPKFSVVGTGEYSNYKIMESVDIGDTLSIGYVINGNENKIVEAQTDGEQIRSIEGYNSWLHNQRVMGYIAFSVVEVVFWAILTLYIVLSWKDLKFFKECRREHRGQFFVS